MFYLLQVVDEGVFVIFPVAFESLFRWELLTAKLHSDLKAVAAQVIEVLHSCPSSKKSVRTYSVCVQKVSTYTRPSDNLRPSTKDGTVGTLKDSLGVYTEMASHGEQKTFLRDSCFKHTKSSVLNGHLAQCNHVVG